MLKYICVIFSFVLFSNISLAGTFPRVDADIAEYERTVAQMRADFAKTPANPKKKSWVQQKLDFMVKVDQYMRNFGEVEHKRGYSPEESEYFRKWHLNQFAAIDSVNTSDLKGLLAIYTWFRISEFGEAADKNAWLLVQHADLDVPFQKQVLTVLEKLYPMGETVPSNYAYLYDRVAASWSDESKRTLQRYGTQGLCAGPGIWEPIPMEDPKNVDSRRAKMGLESMEKYKARFKDLCR